MPRYRLTIAYDGTDFCGWQKQEPPQAPNIDPAKVMAAGAEPNARFTLRTVQEVVERAVREVVREPIELVGASRTDSGVHARGQVAAFSCSEEAWPSGRGLLPLLRAINSKLPEDVLIAGVEEAPSSFNPIGGATSKGYSYTLHVSPHRPLWDRRFVHHVWVPLELERMRSGAARFVGEHDFAAFAAAGHGRQSTVRTIYACDVVEVEGTEARRHGGTMGHEGTEARRHEGRKQSGNESASATPGPDWSRRLRIDIAGNGFLWNMVRIIAGTLVDIGRGRMSPDDVAAAIEHGDRRKAGPTLPATGLCLEWIRYD